MNSFSSQANNAMPLSRYRNPALFVEHSLRPGDGKRSIPHWESLMLLSHYEKVEGILT